jgi:hypothetical protein
MENVKSMTSLITGGIKRSKETLDGSKALSKK